MKLLLKIMYDGTRFSGYQFQPDRRTVQGELTNALSRCFGFPCAVTGCSRTDAGVHATSFCATVEPKNDSDRITVPVGKVHRALDSFLPRDISVAGEAEVESDFHARYSVVSKEYTYKMYMTPSRNPFLESRAWHLKRPIDSDGLERMRSAAKYIVGKHDFCAFMSSGSRIEDSVRTVHSLDITKNGAECELKISADGFLYNMVRIITGTLVECAYRTLSPVDVKRIIESQDRRRAGRTAPPDGLYLTDVSYSEEIVWQLL